MFSSLFLDLFFLSFFVRLGEDVDLGEDADFIIAVAAAGEEDFLIILFAILYCFQSSSKYFLGACS